VRAEGDVKPKRRNPATWTTASTQRQQDVLAALAIYDEWATPLDVGSTFSSHHSMTLRTLFEKGFVERRPREMLLSRIHGTALYRRLTAPRREPRAPMRGFHEYRITDAGRRDVATRRAK
jgi:hypothetical protein